MSEPPPLVQHYRSAWIWPWAGIVVSAACVVAAVAIPIPSNCGGDNRFINPGTAVAASAAVIDLFVAWRRRDITTAFAVALCSFALVWLIVFAALLIRLGHLGWQCD